jgi:hypothetical protein
MSLVLPIFQSFIYKTENDCCSHDNNGEAEKHRRIFIVFVDSPGIRESFISTVVPFIASAGQDATLLALIMTILILTPGLSMNEDETFLNDSLAVHCELKGITQHYFGIIWLLNRMKCMPENILLNYSQQSFKFNQNAKDF